MDDFAFEIEEEVETGFRLRGRQQEWCDAVEADLESGLQRLLFNAAGGVGKCLGKDTPIMMFDGSVKPVQCVSVGDLLMGPDSCSRRVESLARGHSELFEVTPTKGDSYVVNDSHLIALKASLGPGKKMNFGEKALLHGDNLFVRAHQFMEGSRSFRKSVVGWRSPAIIKWNQEPHPDLPPYILGAWLGDGTTGEPHFTVGDEEVYQEIKSYAKSIGARVTRSVYYSKGCYRASVVPVEKGWYKNKLKEALKSMGIYGLKSIPTRYKLGSVCDRQQLLAGLIDTDGSLMHGCYDFISITEKLSLDVCFIARSLGLAAYLTKVRKACQTGAVGTYYRVCISGDIDQIPCRIARKKACPRKQRKNVRHVGLSVRSIGRGEYFGFSVSGPDRLFLLGDFTVTHNSTCFAELARRAHVRQKKTLVIINREALVRQSAKRIANETGIEVDVEMASEHASPYAPIVMASVQTLGRVNRLTAFDPSHFDRVMVDECHLSMCDQWLRVMNWFVYGEQSLAEGWERPTDNVHTGLANVIGFTATPILEGKKNLMNWFQHESVNYPYFQAVQEGWLVGAEQRSIPVKIDLRNARKKQTDHGADLNTSDVTQALIPVIEQLADQMLENATDRKSMCFLPSVETSKMMADALSRRGFDACFVSGACEDGDEKTERFRAGGRGAVLCNAQIYNYGIDFPDVDCIGWFRPTLSRPFYLQGVFRGSRVLPGILDGLETVEQRIAAIAASAKKDFLIIDPLFQHEKFPLCDAYDLFAETPEIKEKMKADGLPPTQESAERAGRDMIKALEKAARKQANKEARRFKALDYAVSIGSEKLANYRPTLAWHSQPPSEGQLALLRRWGFDPSGITMKGLASEMIGTLTARKSLKLATPAQLNFMHKLGIPDGEASKLTEEAANAAITRAKAARGWA